MGVVIHDEITLPSGLKVKDAYAGFALNLISVTPTDDPASPTGKAYLIQSPYNIWVSDATRQAGKDPLMVKQLAFKMGPESLTQGVYTVLYGQLCSLYTNYTNTDVLPAQSPQPASQTNASASTSSQPSSSTDAAQPAPSDTTPAQPASSDSTSTQPASSEPTPADSTSTQPPSSDTTPAQPASSDSTSTQPASSDSTPTDSTSTQPASADTTPAQSTSTQPASSDPTPAS